MYPARPAARAVAERRLPNTPSNCRRKQFDASAELLGYMLGNALYDAYLEGSVSTAALRRLFLAGLEEPGKAKEVYQELTGKLRRKNAWAAGAGS